MKMKRLLSCQFIWISAALPIGLCQGQTPAAVGPANQNDAVITAPADPAPGARGTRMPVVADAPITVSTGGGVPCAGGSCCGADFGPLWASYCADKQRCCSYNTTQCSETSCRCVAPTRCVMPPATFSRHRCVVPRHRCVPVRRRRQVCDEWDACDGGPVVPEAANRQINLGPPPAIPRRAQPLPLEPASPNDAKPRVKPKPPKTANLPARHRDSSSI